MAVAFFQEITGRDGNKDVDSNKRYRRTFILRTDRVQDGASVVLAHPGIPAFNAPYSYVDDSVPGAPTTITDNSAVVVDIQVAQDNSNDPQDWRVTVQYAGVEDPTAQPAEVEYSPNRYQKALVKDLAGNAVVNSADDPFETGITVDRTRFTLTLVKAVDTWDPVAMLAYQDSLNLGTFLAVAHPPGFTTGTCKLTIGAKRVRRKGTLSFYWLRTAVIDIDREGWKVKVRDAGFNEAIRDGEGVIIKKRRIYIEPGVPTSSLWPLDLEGGKLAPGDPLPPPLEFVGYETKDWAPLMLEY